MPAARNVTSRARAHYELVDDTEVEATLDVAAAHFRLQRQQNANKASALHEPLVAPPSLVVERNPEAGNRRFAFVFVDTGAKYKNHERRVLIRENGILDISSVVTKR